MRKIFLTFLLAISVVSVAYCQTACSNESSVNHIQVPAINIASPMDVNVILPKSYATSILRNYPVVYILHGYSGDYNAWLSLTEPRLDSLASHYEMLFVLPDGRDSWYWDAPTDSNLKMESFFVDELVPYIDKNYDDFGFCSSYVRIQCCRSPKDNN